MNPAYSVIFFTTASGAGYGLLTWLSLAQLYAPWQSTGAARIAALILALALISAGLLASTAHLGHPERAWRALSQWRSSWLSREGIAAVLTYLPAGGLLFSWCCFPPTALAVPLAIAAATLALVTVYCTAMIYASLKPIPRWHNAWVPPIYLGFALATGAVLFSAIRAIDGSLPASLLCITLIVSIATWITKWIYWRWIDRVAPTVTAASATGLSEYSLVRMLDPPHTSKNYVQHEMAYRIARKHALRLRSIAIGLGLLSLPMLIAAIQGPNGLAPLWASMAAAITLLAVTIERWLFFAEAEHVVGLYYGKQTI